MKKQNLQNIVCLLIACWTSLLVLDTFVLPSEATHEILDYKDYAVSRTSKMRSYKSYLFIAQSKQQYLVPKEVYLNFNSDGPFIIRKSVLFEKPLKIEWCSGDGCYGASIGTFNSTYFGNAALAVLILFPLFLIFFGKALPAERSYNFFMYLCVVSVGTFAFHIVY